MSKPILEANAVVPLYRQLMEKLQKEITSADLPLMVISSFICIL